MTSKRWHRDSQDCWGGGVHTVSPMHLPQELPQSRPSMWGTGGRAHQPRGSHLWPLDLLLCDLPAFQVCTHSNGRTPPLLLWELGEADAAPATWTLTAGLLALLNSWAQSRSYGAPQADVVLSKAEHGPTEE